MTVAADILAFCEEHELEVVRLEPREFFDRFIVGLSERFGQPLVLAYDLDAIRDAFVNEDGMDPDDADEYIEFNVLGAWMGDATPTFLRKPCV
jgi:hypothetical protein